MNDALTHITWVNLENIRSVKPARQDRETAGFHLCELFRIGEFRESGLGNIGTWENRWCQYLSEGTEFLRRGMRELWKHEGCCSTLHINYHHQKSHVEIIETAHSMVYTFYNKENPVRDYHTLILNNQKLGFLVFLQNMWELYKVSWKIHVMTKKMHGFSNFSCTNKLFKSK